MHVTAQEVRKLLGVSKSKSYEIIAQLNQELQEKGYLTLRGKVEKRYLYERFRIAESESVIDA